MARRETVAPIARSLFARESWRRAAEALRPGRARRALIALDLDGTLAPIARRPELARVPAATLGLLGRMARTRGVQVALVSARTRRDMVRFTPVSGIQQVALYGLEGSLAPPPALRRRFERDAARIEELLAPVAASTPGASVESKGMTVALHDRLVPPGRLAAMRRAVRHVERQAAKLGFVPMRGRRVTEFVPSGYDKGRAMTRLRRKLAPAVVFYFGDSEADEPVFEALGPEDFPVRVGLGPTRARYRVRGPGEVARFFRELLSLRAGPTA